MSQQNQVIQHDETRHNTIDTNHKLYTVSSRNGNHMDDEVIVDSNDDNDTMSQDQPNLEKKYDTEEPFLDEENVSKFKHKSILKIESNNAVGFDSDSEHEESLEYSTESDNSNYDDNTENYTDASLVKDYTTENSISYQNFISNTNSLTNFTIKPFNFLQNTLTEKLDNYNINSTDKFNLVSTSYDTLLTNETKLDNNNVSEDTTHKLMLTRVTMLCPILILAVCVVYLIIWYKRIHKNKKNIRSIVELKEIISLQDR